jgi:hypothetical protein
VKRTFTFKLSIMLGTHQLTPAVLAGFFCAGGAKDVQEPDLRHTG